MNIKDGFTTSSKEHLRSLVHVHELDEITSNGGKDRSATQEQSYGPPWAHYLDGYQDRLVGGPLGLPGLRYTVPDGVEHKDYGGEVLG
jgi:hypothetical protein